MGHIFPYREIRHLPYSLQNACLSTQPALLPALAYVDPGDGSRHALELGQGDAQRAVAGATRAVDRVEAPQRLVEVDGDPVLEAKGSDATRRVTDRRLGHGRAGGIELPDAVGQPIACQVGTDVFDGDEITPFLRS